MTFKKGVTRADSIRVVDNEGNAKTAAEINNAANITSAVGIPPNSAKADPSTLGFFDQKTVQLSLNDPGVAAALLAGQTTGNIPKTSTGIMSQITDFLKSQNINIEEKPNVLNNFANYTYHIKLSFTGDIYSYDIFDSAAYQKVPKQVIAESGVTAGFNIKDFEIQNTCSAGNRTGIMIYTNWKMTITEPYGFSLIDKIYTFAQQSGIANHLTCPYFIEVWFTGYNEDGTVADLTPIYKLFRCFITRIDVDSSESGSTYVVNGVFDGSLGTSDEFAMPPSNITIENVGTLGGFFKVLADKLNTQNRSLQYNKAGRRVEYIFKMPKEWESWSLNRDSADPSRTSGWEFHGLPTKPTIVIPKGTDISNILLTVMSMTKEGKLYTLGPNKQTGTGGQPAPPGQPNSPTSRSTTENGIQGTNRIPLVHTSVKLIGYNYLINDYVREITYSFLDYTTVRGYVDKAAIDAAQTPSSQQERLKNFVTTGRLSKLYNYIFTGDNIDIIKFDIKLENFWAAAQPINDGENTGGNFSIAPSATGQTVSNDILSQYKKAQQDVNSAQAKVTGLKADNSPDGQRQLAVAEQELKKAQDIEAGLVSKQNQTTFESRFVSPGGQAEAAILANPDLIRNDAVRRSINQQLAYQTLLKGSKKDRYLEDISPAPPVSNPLPMSIFTSNAPVTQVNSLGGEPIKDPAGSTSAANMPRSRGLLASVINNVTLSPFFTNIDLEIRGDPYWLGLGNIDENNKVSSTLSGQPLTAPTNGDAFFGNGEVAFLLYFRTGEQPSEDTGFVEFDKDSWAFSGIYVVINVTSKFQNGQFTQVLKGLKDVAMFSIFNNVQNGNQEVSLAASPSPISTSDFTRSLPARPQ